MLDPSNVPAIDANELLARYILSERHFSRDNRRVKSGAFLPASNGELSVTRHRDATDNELWHVGRGIATSRQVTLYARGDVLAATCIDQRLNIEAAPIDGNPNHANVVGWPMHDKAARKAIAEQIALVAKFVPPPEFQS